MRAPGFASLVALTVVAVCVTAVPAAQAATVRPTIKTLHVSASNRPYAGGKIRVTATLQHATYCVFTTKPSLGTSGKRYKCTAGKFHRTVKLPANLSASKHSYRLTLKVSGHQHSMSRSLTVTQLPAAPTVSKTTVSPARPSRFGGNVTLKAALRGAKTCTLTSKPDLGISAKTFACTHSAFHRAVSIPENDTASPRRYVITLTAKNAGGKATGTYTIDQPASPPTFDSYATNPTALSVAGGPITVSAQVELATTCTFTTSPAIGNTTADCSGGMFSDTVTVPPNLTGAKRNYSFTLELKGNGGTASQTITLTQPAA